MTPEQATFEDYLRASRFSGCIDPLKDCDPLTSQIAKIYHLMKDQNWRTLQEIEEATGYPQASVSAQLRNLRKGDYGWQTVNKRRRGELRQWEYQLIPRF